MASQTIVFDPTAGVPVGANLTIYGGSALAADFNITDILNQIRAVRKITIVTIITPENYVQRPNEEYQLLKIKLVTRDDPKNDIEKITKDILTSDLETNSLRIPGIKNMKFKQETIKRL